jgi:uncharacterized membrane protein YcaP (DUF421 family)
VDHLFRADWHALFVPTTSLLEIVIRGAITYFILFGVLRIMRRESGAIGISDLLVVVLIADAIQNAMAGEYTSITEGVVLVVTIAVCDYLLDWLGYHVPLFERFLRPAPLPLIEDGQIVRRNLRQEMITHGELMGLLREQGIEEIASVKRCFIEGDGRVSVIEYEQGTARRGAPDDHRAG